jgi:hypothetical protein
MALSRPQFTLSILRGPFAANASIATIPIGGEEVEQREHEMRKLKCFQIGGQHVQEVLDEFNERREEFGVPDSNILSISAMPSTSTIPQAQPDGSTKLPKVEVVIVCGSDEASK